MPLNAEIVVEEDVKVMFQRIIATSNRYLQQPEPHVLAVLVEFKQAAGNDVL